MSLELQLLKDIYVMRDIPNSHVDSLQVLLYQHAFLSALSGQKKFDGNVRAEPQPRIISLGKEEIKNAKVVSEWLKKHLGLNSNFDKRNLEF